MRNCANIKASSAIVPSDPINHGRFVMMYSLSREWKRMLAPYVILPIRDRTKKRRDRPTHVRYCEMMNHGILTFARLVPVVLYNLGDSRTVTSAFAARL